MQNIAILMGGISKEKEISIKSAQTIKKYIDQKKYFAYEVLCIDKNKFFVVIDRKKIPIDLNDFSFMIKQKRIKLEKVFMMIHGVPGENGELCTYFESIDIPYTSCNEKISKLTFNKFQCNKYLKKLGYTVPEARVYMKNMEINFPCIIKPSSTGSSFGISKVNDKKDLPKLLQNAKQYGDEIIIEEFIQGKEVTCGLFKFGKNIKVLPITEIISENEIFDYDAKYNGKSIEKTPADITNSMKKKIEDISRKIYNQLTLSGVVRIDFIIKQNEPYLIEINTVPGFSEESIVPKMLKCAGIDIKTFISTQIDSL